jgi:hypothetical protein
MTTTGICETNRAALEGKYGIPWHRTPENRAFLGARLKCEQPGYPYYESTGGRGIRFLYDSVDDFLADVGLRPGENFALDRIDMDKNFEPGNVRWSPKFEIVRKSRPVMQAERGLDSMMLRIIRTLKRHNMEMHRAHLQCNSGSSKWGSALFHEAVQRLIALGFIEHKVVDTVREVADGHRPGLSRKVTRRIAVVRLLQKNLQNFDSQETTNANEPAEPTVAV